MRKRIVFLLLVLAILLAFPGSVSMADASGDAASLQNGTLSGKTQATLIENDTVTLDIESLSLGAVRVRYNKTDSSQKVKLIIQKDKMRYIYNLQADGQWQTYSFQMGSGSYNLQVLVNKKDNLYNAVLDTDLEVELSSQEAPFLHSNPMVRFSEDSKTVELARSLTQGKTTDREKAQAIYEYVVNNIKYDYDKAKTVKPGYRPDCDEILEAGKGICFDYASLLSAMLRAVDIPAKLVTGYVAPRNSYHAWNEVYLNDSLPSEVELDKPFCQEGWVRLDATHRANARDSARSLEFTGNDLNYVERLEY